MNLSSMPQPRAASVPHTDALVVFDTERVDENDRFGLWRDHVANVLAVFDFDPAEDRPFHARMETLNIGGIKINRGDSSTSHWIRRPHHVSDGRCHTALYLGGSGSFRMMQGGIDTVGGPNHFALIDDSRPSEFHVECSIDDYGLAVCPDLLHAARGGNQASPLPPHGPANAGLQLLRGYLDAIYAAPFAAADVRLEKRLEQHLLDLIVLGLAPTPDAAHAARHRGLKAARTQAILAKIESRYLEPGINAKTIASELNISQRYLHQLLDERGLTFSHLILEKRLDRAFALLRDPAQDALRIGQIAYACGFNDLSHFTRTFRVRFGETPGGVRAGHPQA
ncbi:MAG: helix-turn-helix domain-containing protein [Aestuariivirga sp.]